MLIALLLRFELNWARHDPFDGVLYRRIYELRTAFDFVTEWQPVVILHRLFALSADSVVIAQGIGDVLID